MKTATALCASLTQPSKNGVYQLATPDLPHLAQACALAQLVFHRVELNGVQSKINLFTTLVKTLPKACPSISNFDALADVLGDLALIEQSHEGKQNNKKGHVFLFAHSHSALAALANDGEVFLDVLRGAAEEWQQRQSPFFAFFDSELLVNLSIELLPSFPATITTAGR